MRVMMMVIAGSTIGVPCR